MMDRATAALVEARLDNTNKNYWDAIQHFRNATGLLPPFANAAPAFLLTNPAMSHFNTRIALPRQDIFASVLSSTLSREVPREKKRKAVLLEGNVKRTVEDRNLHVLQQAVKLVSQDLGVDVVHPASRKKLKLSSNPPQECVSGFSKVNASSSSKSSSGDGSHLDRASNSTLEKSTSKTQGSRQGERQEMPHLDQPGFGNISKQALDCQVERMIERHMRRRLDMFEQQRHPSQLNGQKRCFGSGAA